MSCQNLYEETPSSETITLTREEVNALLEAVSSFDGDSVALQSAYMALLTAKQSMDPISRMLKRQAA